MVFLNKLLTQKAPFVGSPVVSQYDYFRKNKDVAHGLLSSVGFFTAAVLPPCGVCLLCECRWCILNKPLSKKKTRPFSTLLSRRIFHSCTARAPHSSRGRHTLRVAVVSGVFTRVALSSFATMLDFTGYGCLALTHIPHMSPPYLPCISPISPRYRTLPLATLVPSSAAR